MSLTVLTHCFTPCMHEDVEYLAQFLLKKDTDFRYSDQNTITLSQQKIALLLRVDHHVSMHYDFTNFPLKQRQILWCILSRHHDGFTRQLMIEKLMKHPLEYFMMPFIFQLLGEYVQEILQLLSLCIDQENQPLFIQFMGENPQYFHTTQRRIISYWNEYYRNQYPRFKDYVGAEILHKLKH